MVSARDAWCVCVIGFLNSFSYTILSNLVSINMMNVLNMRVTRMQSLMCIIIVLTIAVSN